MGADMVEVDVRQGDGTLAKRTVERVNWVTSIQQPEVSVPTPQVAHSEPIQAPQGGVEPAAVAPGDQSNPARFAVLAPYWVNFHSEHHLFTQLPCWQLPRAHALLQAAGTTARMEVQPGYLAVMRLAAPS